MQFFHEEEVILLMLSLAYIIVLGLLGAYVFRFLRLPGLIGMLLVGILIGPSGFDLLEAPLLLISEDLRKIALIIILLRAGLGLNREAVASIGKRASALSVIPLLLEGTVVMVLAVLLFGFDFIQGGMLGFIVAAVSPAVIVPAMLRLMRDNIGMKKRIPVLVLSSASVDDVIAITIFSAFLSVYFSQTLNIVAYVYRIPLSISLGVLLGVGVGYVFVRFFKRYHVRDTKKILILIAAGILMVSLTEVIADYVMVASLLGVMTLGIMIREKNMTLGKRLSIKLDKVWVFAELFLFVLVGASLNVSVALEAGIFGIIIVVCGVIARSIGVFLATILTDFTISEKWFIVFSYIPKATVQAAVGSIPLSLGVAGGEIILAVAVIAILITAPIGSILIQFTAKKLLEEATE